MELQKEKTKVEASLQRSKAAEAAPVQARGGVITTARQVSSFFCCFFVFHFRFSLLRAESFRPSLYL
jgi:hypothetical protein